MPKKAIDYSKTIIYKIVCKDLSITNCYIGHTTNFTKRKTQHKSDCNKFNYLVYETIRNNGRWENWVMIEIEKYPCNDVNEACLRERYWIELLKADLNKCIPIRNEPEYWNNYKKEYYKQNKDTINKQNKQNYEKNKENIIIKHKEYAKQNRNKTNEIAKKYRDKNKDEINKKRRELRNKLKLNQIETFSSI